MTLSSYLGPLVFVTGGALALLTWRRAGRRLPWYVHALGIIGAGTGVWMATLDGGGWQQQVPRALLYAGVMVALVYVTFGFYGGAVMRDRDDGESGNGAA